MLFFFLSKCRKRGLPAKLKRHKEKSEEIQMHCRNSKRQRITTSAKHPDKGSRNRGNQSPDCQGIHNGNSRNGSDRLFHTLIFLRTVIVSKHRLTPVSASMESPPIRPINIRSTTLYRTFISCANVIGIARRIKIFIILPFEKSPFCVISD